MEDSRKIFLKPDIEDYLRHSFPVNKSHLDKLLELLATPPLFTTVRTQSKNASCGCQTELQDELSKQCADLCWDQFHVIVHPAIKDCLVVRNRGPYDVAKHSAEIVVDVHCGQAVLRGANVFAQGMLGVPHGLCPDNPVSVYADLDKKCLKGMAANYPGRKLFIGSGVSRVSREDLFNSKPAQSGVGVVMTQPLYQAPSLAELDPTRLFPQNLPSIICGHALDPQPGEVILDMCAAPGGKTLHILSLMEGKGRLVALEKSGQRAARLEETLKQRNIDIAEVYTSDASKSVSLEAELSKGPPYPPESFDKILLDAPCSALGQRPCLANHITLNQIKSYPVVQRKLLVAAVQLLRPGGTLVYSTCTLPKEENEDQVFQVLTSCQSMELVSVPFASSCGGLACTNLTPDERSKVLRFDPAVTDSGIDPWDSDTIGFFIAKFRKKS